MMSIFDLYGQRKYLEPYFSMSDPGVLFYEKARRYESALAPCRRQADYFRNSWLRQDAVQIVKLSGMN